MRQALWFALTIWTIGLAVIAHGQVDAPWPSTQREFSGVSATWLHGQKWTQYGGEQWQTHRARFFAARRWTDPPLRTNREILRDKTFMASEASFLGATIADSEATHQGVAHHRCREANPNLDAHPSRGSLYAFNMIPFAAVSTLNFVSMKYFWKPTALGPNAYGTIIHLKGAASWWENCW